MKNNRNEDLYTEFLMSLPSFSKDMGLEGIRTLLNELGNFHHKLRVIHIAGTNGKGSSATMLSSIYSNAGYSVGTFISPYFSDIRECILINTTMIPIELMNDATFQVKEAYHTLTAQRLPLPTHYECITVVALLSMHLSSVEICIIETLMGGRNDATNIFSSPMATLITAISLDHTEYLGDTIDSIAQHKAGIIKEHCPIVINKNSDSVLAIIQSEAQTKHANITYSWNTQNQATQDYASFLALKGTHQYENLLGVLCVIDILKNILPVDSFAVTLGLKSVLHPCRIEHLTYSHLPFILDGSHNVQGIEALVSYIKCNYSDTYITLIFGVLKDKDWKQITHLIYPIAQHVILINPQNPRALDSITFFDSLTSEDQSKSILAKTMEDALSLAIQYAQKDANINKAQAKPSLIIACGSFSISFPIRNLISQ